ncbi:sugar transferase [Halobacillus litoralis]|uniref:sugar transferase n=1 Tax=Halobacillus litoralis TaxID=45668 RepID=UPI001CFDE7D6|nr:sugar transferase [Halobacillus litoralis]
MKRLSDLFAALATIIILSPLIATVGLLVKLTLGSPVIFKQKRVGQHCETFIVYKFRSMRNAKDGDGNDLPDDKRITAFGKFIRMSSLDELPQLWNVLKGDMSLVGPRPLLVKYLPYYTPEENKRHLVRPGITGLAQVSGRNCLGWEKRLALDIKYVETMSIRMDLYILMQTIQKVLLRDGMIEVQREVLSDLDVERKKLVKSE